MGIEAREEPKNQELDDLALVWSHIVASMDSLVLKWALDLGIADIIHGHGEPMTLSQLGAALPVHCGNYDNLRRLMRYLVHMRLLCAGQVDDMYQLTSASKFILVDDQKNLVPFARLIQQGDADKWHALGSLLEAKATTFEAVNGEDMWSYAAKNAEHNKLFNEAMASDARLVTPALIDGCKDIFRGIKSLVDVGGGTGTASRGIARAFPHIKCSVLDLPHVVETIPDYPVEVEHFAGDMFSFIPRNDAVMMMKILHDWDDEDCVKILKRCKEAIPEEGGKVIIVDIVLDIDEGHDITRTRYAFDVIMMISTGGKERTEKEWRRLIFCAGFSQCEITPINALQSAIVASP
ncbi:(RS)-norcoclaurine 6-O-methyltransferase-like [Tasmannia lanceolata]|uniref:(RS)-norcoclaurine 6-O-methyltransferase-like n=1 Tax=Tasmannia lanceolata TaxID=3420 RepID=UPI0040645380